ncbi:hypothetical protein HPB52_008142 [Rhipicephalus sanguineus]|uniref:Uncharacterized protein n=1 Tax=Rhipicephalus sanguineus TaxID=34632 RepID=A0A9D4PVB7_RHISA|nr:hypothetical protein HPB52_008142 [Rhipicephalus sanguineus]
MPERDLPSTSKLCVSCQQRSASPSTSPAAAVRAPHQLRPNMRDAATMTESPEDDMPVSSKAAPHANVTPATTADVQYSDLRCYRRCFTERSCTVRTCRDYACSVAPRVSSGAFDTRRHPHDI